MFKGSPQKISSLQNPLVKHFVRLRKEKNYRIEQQRVLVMGKKLVSDLAKTQKILRLLSQIPLDLPAEESLLAEEPIFKKITGMPTPEGVIAECALPKPCSLANKAPLLLLDRIADPGNMGTLLRTALAMNWRGVYFLEGCVDPFHEKVMRASQGALFFLPWQVGTLEQMPKLKTYIADTSGTPIASLRTLEKFQLVLGSEAHGPNKEIEGEHITIPMNPQIESLNVAIAGSILMHSLQTS